jgi:hypothetical protein
MDGAGNGPRGRDTEIVPTAETLIRQARPAGAEAEAEGTDEDASGEAGLGGDPVCWAHLVCPECGAITSEGHRARCTLA